LQLGNSVIIVYKKWPAFPAFRTLAIPMFRWLTGLGLGMLFCCSFLGRRCATPIYPLPSYPFLILHSHCPPKMGWVKPLCGSTRRISHSPNPRQFPYAHSNNNNNSWVVRLISLRFNFFTFPFPENR
jgi:hypothetical protein